jgi:hypothetical protein
MRARVGGQRGAGERGPGGPKSSLVLKEGLSYILRGVRTALGREHVELMSSSMQLGETKIEGRQVRDRDLHPKGADSQVCPRTRFTFASSIRQAVMAVQGCRFLRKGSGGAWSGTPGLVLGLKREGGELSYVKLEATQ